MNNCIIKNNSQMNIDDEIHSLVNFTKQRLGFKKPPTIFLNNDIDNSEKTLAKTGYYDPSTMEIHVFTTGRHPKDVLRSIAHELVHHNQNENGDFENSGYSGKGYAQKNPHLRKMELQANDPMLFRDWEDSLKEKYPTIYNERRTLKMSTKDWKNKELSENLNKKWGFKMDLKKLNEAHCGTSESHCNEEEEKLEEEEKPDFPDVDGDGDREEPISKAQQDKKDGGSDEKKEDESSDKKEDEGNDKEESEDKDLSKVPPQLRDHVKGKMKENKVNMKQLIEKVLRNNKKVMKKLKDK